MLQKDPHFCRKRFSHIKKKYEGKNIFFAFWFMRQNERRKEEGRGKIKEYFRKRALSRSCAQWSINGKAVTTTQRDKGKEEKDKYTKRGKGKYSVGEIGMYKHVFSPPRMDFRSPPDKYTAQYFLFLLSLCSDPFRYICEIGGRRVCCRFCCALFF